MTPLRRLFLVALAAMMASPLLAQAPAAQPTMPAARPADVASIPAIMKATYDAISGPAGPRDWDRFRSLFVPDARLIPVACPQGGTCRPVTMSVERYIEQAGSYFNTSPFYEVETNSVVEEYGHIAHVFSTYESRRDPAAEPFTRGINTFQLFNDGTRWYVVSIMWDDENTAGEIPAKYR